MQFLSVEAVGNAAAGFDVEDVGGLFVPRDVGHFSDDINQLKALKYIINRNRIERVSAGGEVSQQQHAVPAQMLQKCTERRVLSRTFGHRAQISEAGPRRCALANRIP